jgi:ATP-binding cassette subfamily B protein
MEQLVQSIVDASLDFDEEVDLDLGYLEGGTKEQTADATEVAEATEHTEIKEEPKAGEASKEGKGKEKEKYKRDPEAAKKAKELLGLYVKKHRGLLLVGFVLQIVGMVGEFSSPLFIGLVIDAIREKDMDRVKELVIYWVIINTASAVFSGIQRFVFQLTTERIGMDLRQDVFEEIIHKDVEFFDSRKTGDLISRLSADTSKIESALSTQIAMLVKSLLFSIVVLVMFFIISW